MKGNGRWIKIHTFSSAWEGPAHPLHPPPCCRLPSPCAALAVLSPWSGHTWMEEYVPTFVGCQTEFLNHIWIDWLCECVAALCRSQLNDNSYLAQKWRGVSPCLLHTLIEAPFSKRRLTTWYKMLYVQIIFAKLRAPQCCHCWLLKEVEFDPIGLPSLTSPFFPSLFSAAPEYRTRL